MTTQAKTKQEAAREEYRFIDMTEISGDTRQDKRRHK